MRQFVTFGLLGLLFYCYLVLRQTSQEIRKVKSLNRKKPVYTLASVYTDPSTISLAIATVLFCFLHMVRWNSAEWNNYINFRDYLNRFPDKAIEYDICKKELAAQFADDRWSYTTGKQELIGRLLKEAHAWKSGT